MITLVLILACLYALVVVARTTGEVRDVLSELREDIMRLNSTPLCTSEGTTDQTAARSIQDEN